MDIYGFLTAHHLPNSYADTAQMWFIPLCEQLLKHQKSAKKPFIVGINGCQGSGKSTLTSFIETFLKSEHDMRVVSLSIDDFYLDKNHRNALAIKVHPLLKTRGVPGTHNISLALDTFSMLEKGERTQLPRFDKSTDNPFPISQWPVMDALPDVIILEGWCVGVSPQESSALTHPVNALESEEDSLCTWRSFVNSELGNQYQTLFNKIDYSVMLAAPSFDSVLHWRLEQEHKLAKTSKGEKTGVMNDDEVARFIEHYQRLTEHALSTLPQQCDTVFYLDEHRNITQQDLK